jgi:DNA-directed RNA polymerase subunit RPC12/RpoP
MSLKCSLLGHRFDESAVEHDREEDGSEVVIVTTELEACTRCGETRVVSENKEVRTTEAPDDAASGGLPFDGTSDDGPGEAVTDATAGADAAATGDAAGTDTAGEVDTDEDATATAVSDEGAGADDETPAPTGGEILGEDGTADDGDGDESVADDERAADEEVADEQTADDGAGEDGTVTTETPAAGDSIDGAAGDADVEDTTDPEREDAEILGSDDAGTGSTDTEADAQAQARGDPTPIPDAESGESATGAGTDADDEEVTDDAVIIDGDSGDGRDSGEWPEETTAGEGDTEGPDSERAGGSTSSGDAETEDVPDIDDDSVVWAGETDDETSEAGSGSVDAEWPEEEAGETADGPLGEWPDETMPDGTDDEAAGPTFEETASPTITVPEGMYKCSECGFTADVESSPHRAGDFCPECHHGTLVQDEDGAN